MRRGSARGCFLVSQAQGRTTLPTVTHFRKEMEEETEARTWIVSLRWTRNAECSSAFVTDMYESLRSVYLPTSAMLTVSNRRSWLQSKKGDNHVCAISAAAHTLQSKLSIVLPAGRPSACVPPIASLLSPLQLLQALYRSLLSLFILFQPKIQADAK